MPSSHRSADELLRDDYHDVMDSLKAERAERDERWNEPRRDWQAEHLESLTWAMERCFPQQPPACRRCLTLEAEIGWLCRGCAADCDPGDCQ